MKYNTRKQARNVATLLNDQFGDIVKASTVKTANGWQVTFKRGVLSLRKDTLKGNK